MRLEFATVAIALAILAPTARASAQSSPTGSPFATISGVAIDSIRGGYLRNATISVAGTKRSSMTDSLGRFTIDSVPAGEHKIRITHPLLDSLAVAILTPIRPIAAGESISIVVSTPAPKTIAAAKCSPEMQKLGPSAVLGTVFDAESENPSTGAKVSMEWTDYELGAKSVTSTPRSRVTSVAADGTFRLCGLPSDLNSGVFASRGADTTAALMANLAPGLAIVSFHLPRTEVDSAVRVAAPRGDSIEQQSFAAIRGRAVVTGRVTDPAGKPMRGARAAIEEDGIAATTSDDGTFALRGLRSGTRALTIRKIGFEAVHVPVELTELAPQTVSVQLSKFVPVLETVKVTALRELGLDRVGFAARKKSGMGRYLTPEELSRRNFPRLNDLLRGIPFLRYGRSADGQDIITARFNGCVRYFMDGRLWESRAGSPGDFYSGSEIGAVEAYDALSAPAEFISFDFNGQTCAPVVMWTKWKLRIK